MNTLTSTHAARLAQAGQGPSKPPTQLEETLESIQAKVLDAESMRIKLNSMNGAIDRLTKLCEPFELAGEHTTLEHPYLPVKQLLDSKVTARISAAIKEITDACWLAGAAGRLLERPTRHTHTTRQLEHTLASISETKTHLRAIDPATLDQLERDLQEMTPFVQAIKAHAQEDPQPGTDKLNGSEPKLYKHKVWMHDGMVTLCNGHTNAIEALKNLKSAPITSALNPTDVDLLNQQITAHHQKCSAAAR